MTAEIAERAGAEFVSKQQLFERSDILTIHLVLSQRSRGLVEASLLNLMKPTARLVNTSRGPIVDEAALIDVLERRRICGRSPRCVRSGAVVERPSVQKAAECPRDAAHRLRCARIVSDVLRRHREEHRELAGRRPKVSRSRRRAGTRGICRLPRLKLLHGKRRSLLFAVWPEWDYAWPRAKPGIASDHDVPGGWAAGGFGPPAPLCLRCRWPRRGNRR